MALCMADSCGARLIGGLVLAWSGSVWRDDVGGSSWWWCRGGVSDLERRGLDWFGLAC